MEQAINTSPNVPFFGNLQNAFADAWATLLLGGPVVMLLLAMSIVGVTVTLLKLWQYRLLRVHRVGNARKAALMHRAGRSREALAAVQGDPNPVAQTLAQALRGVLRSDIPESEVREEVARDGAARVEALHAHLRVIEVIAGLAPLLGLFGTVLGMIEAFKRMEAAGSQVNPAVLSGGIWEALLTTAVGLAVAIPMVAVLNWLERTTERTAFEIEDAVSRVFAGDLSQTPAMRDDNPMLHKDRFGAD